MRKLTRFSAAIALFTLSIGVFLFVPGFGADHGAAFAQNEPNSTFANAAYVVGSPDAKLTIIEYMSLTCGHCARFHTETMPGLKEKYIDTGLVRLIARDFPLDGAALEAAMIARCLDEKRRYGFIQLLYKRHRNWTLADDPIATVKRYAQLAGLSTERADACLADDDLARAIVESRQFGENEFNVGGTPTFVIDGRTYQDAYSLEEFEEIILPLLK
jgi:protein-disulfide isomerase